MNVFPPEGFISHWRDYIVGMIPTSTLTDSVFALKFAVRLDGYLLEYGINAMQGAVHKSQWQIFA
jgi:hypothetical protein